MITKEEFKKQWDEAKGPIRIIALETEDKGTIRITSSKTVNTINADEYKIEYFYVRLFYKGTSVGVVSLLDISKVVPGEDKRVSETEYIDEFKRLLQNRNIYDLACALRGNDYGFGEIKYLFTGRIRYYLGIHPLSYWGVVRENKEINVYEVDRIIREIEMMREAKAKDHYLDHISSALDVLRNEEIMPESEYSVLSSLCDEIALYLTDKQDSLKERLGTIRSLLNKLIEGE
jgi:hypothetical protein